MLRGLFKGLRDLIYPNCCLVCKNRIPPPDEQQLICCACWDKLEKNLPPFCASCGRHLTPEAINPPATLRIDGERSRTIEKNACPSCLDSRANFYFDRAFSPCVYTGAVKKLIHEFKYNGKDYLRKPLSQLMHTFIRDYQFPIEHLDSIIPMPLHPSRQRQREFNQSEILGQELAKEFDKRILTNALIRIKPTQTQTELTFQERYQNVEKSFSVVRPELIKDSNLVLIDDVLTTGATANEAAKCLKNAGAKKVLLLTLAS